MTLYGRFCVSPEEFEAGDALTVGQNLRFGRIPMKWGTIPVEGGQRRGERRWLWLSHERS